MSGFLPMSLYQSVNLLWGKKNWLVFILLPISWIFGMLLRLKYAISSIGVLRPKSLPAIVIIIGNVTVGGTGKTPLLIALVNHFLFRGYFVGVISRGYGRIGKGCEEVISTSESSYFGDEPSLIKKKTGAPVFVSRNRYAAGEALLKAYPKTQIIFSDDGLQHSALARDAEICVFDDRGLGNGFLLPAGPLREHWPRKVDWVIHSGNHPMFKGFQAPRNFSHEAICADGTKKNIRHFTNPTQPIVAIAGIAQPEVFFQMLRDQGIHPVKTIGLVDHASMNNLDLTIYKNSIILCTEKDAIKLWSRYPLIWAIPLELKIDQCFLSALETRVTELGLKKLSLHYGHTTS